MSLCFIVSVGTSIFRNVVYQALRGKVSNAKLNISSLVGSLGSTFSIFLSKASINATESKSSKWTIPG